MQGVNNTLFFLLVLDRNENRTSLPEDLAARFGQLYEEYFLSVYNYVSYRVGDRTTSEELTSDIFNKAISSFSRFDSSRASFSTWIFSIARNTLIDYYRGKGRARQLENNLKMQVVMSSTTPEEDASVREERRKLRDCLTKLNDSERELIALKFGSGMNNREIAGLTGRSDSNVGTILCRIIRKLRDEFSGWQNGQ